MVKGEVVVALGVSSEGRIILSRCQVNRSATLPPPNYTGSEEVGCHAIRRSLVNDKLVELWMGVIHKMSESKLALSRNELL
jgi:hypothetical protein